MKRVCLWLGIGLLTSAALIAKPDSEDVAYSAIQRFVEVLDAVRTHHPDLDRLEYDRLVNHALEGMLASLDPHSSFIHPAMAARMQESPGLNPEVGSLGVSFALRENEPYVTTVAPLGPAAEAGVVPGSVVLEIDAKKISAADFSEWIDALNQPAGTVTRLLLKSPTEPKPIEFSLTHRWIEKRSVAESKFWQKERRTGYVRLASFGPSCAREMEAALDELEDAGMTSLILDLRQNGGGDLAETVKILGFFLPPETLVVTTRSRKAKDVTEMKTSMRQRRKRVYPMAVLIDRMSASASELTAGTLQDLKRATIIGELSYGKGSVQNIVPMAGGTALRLTVATYHTPSGNSPHRKGITPDISVSISNVDRENFQLRCQLNNLTAEQQSKIQTWEDPVMKAAVGMLESSVK